MPTTAGTGSEVTVAAVITDEARNYKLSVLGPEISPTYAVLDPELIMTAPASVAAACGVDALTTAMESYINTDANPFAWQWVRRLWSSSAATSASSSHAATIPMLPVP